MVNEIIVSAAIQMIKASESCLVSSVAQSMKANMCCPVQTQHKRVRLCSVDFHPPFLGNLTLCWINGMYMTEIRKSE